MGDYYLNISETSGRFYCIAEASELPRMLIVRARSNKKTADLYTDV